jgi:hypothetical protein
MISDEIRSILKTLLLRSKANQVTWTPFADTEADLEDDYVVSFPKSSVNIFKHPERGIRVNILNSAGKIVGSLDSEESEADSRLLQELLHCARESVFKIDETLEDLKRALAS